MRWLEINGNSGSGKSSLMNAGLLPLVDQGWLWPRTGFERWRRIGPMMPGERPVAMLAEQLARAFGCRDGRRPPAAGGATSARSRDWLRGRKQDDTAFLLAIDQFEELFTFADPAERGRFDRLLATRAGGCRLPAVRDLHRARGLPRPLRRAAAAGGGAQPAGRALDAAADRRPTACARSSPARPGSPAST